MEQSIKTKSTKKVGSTVEVVRELTETLTEQDIIARKQNIEYMRADARTQAQQQLDRIKGFDEQLAECDDLLSQLAQETV